MFLLFIITLTIQNGKKVGGKTYLNLGGKKEELSSREKKIVERKTTPNN